MSASHNQRFLRLSSLSPFEEEIMPPMLMTVS